MWKQRVDTGTAGEIRGDGPLGDVGHREFLSQRRVELEAAEIGGEEQDALG